MAMELLAAEGAVQSVEETFDLVAVLTAFTADTTRLELKLPHMTTGQRKHAKTIAEQFPELVCESLGFGQERRLHFFKSSERASCRKTALETPEKTGCESGQNSRCRTPEPSSGTLDHSRPATGGCAAPSPTHQDLPTEPPEFFQVRNTFIHIEGGDEANDDRAIRSMPHGMFSQCLEAESRSMCPRAAPRYPPPPLEFTDVPPLLAETSQITLGSEVLVVGLTKCPAFNGSRGAVLSYDAEAGRYNVRLANQQMAKIKAENLRLSLESQAHEPFPTFPSTPPWQYHPLYTIPVACQAR
eukprot:TRINITY_DN691_c0_g1_i1.p1 TRINITY_DN691_c0_g1~~TRINITY_DN691_c0_g1_i1.p1  ORF type:complete len:299 (+),score=54.34 TRINITY_DN691_c0_g1_i1:50-946(+)